MNARDELIENLEGKKAISAIIKLGNYYIAQREFILKQNHSPTDWNHFLDQLNFEYDNGYGSQELFGTVWLEDGAWLEREEYDGSEWWALRKLPEIPEDLK